MAASFQVSAPEPFTFSRPDEWPKWIRRFQRFRVASGLSEKDDKTQVNTLIYAMGDQADNILSSFSLSADDSKKYAPVKAKFDGHFVKRRNVIYERARFNMRRQQEGEAADSFITSLYSLAEHCQYGALHDEMIRDRIVVGIRNISLSERMQLQPDLDLEKAVTQVRQAEAIKQQQPLLRSGSVGKPDTPVGTVHQGLDLRADKTLEPPTHLSLEKVQPVPGVANSLLTIACTVRPGIQLATSVVRKGIFRLFAGQRGLATSTLATPLLEETRTFFSRQWRTQYLQAATPGQQTLLSTVLSWNS